MNKQEKADLLNRVYKNIALQAEADPAYRERLLKDATAIVHGEFKKLKANVSDDVTFKARLSKDDPKQILLEALIGSDNAASGHLKDRDLNSVVGGFSSMDIASFETPLGGKNMLGLGQGPMEDSGKRLLGKIF